MIRPNKKKKYRKDKLIYNCIICSKQIIDGIEASIQCNKCGDLCHKLIVYINTVIYVIICVIYVWKLMYSFIIIYFKLNCLYIHI